MGPILFLFLVCLGSGTRGQAQVEYEPQFLEALENHTVTQGRDVIFTCVVNHLGRYKVAWIKSDSKIILAVHTHLVAHNSRLSVTHNGHNTWKLRVSNVQKNDSGTYMCQINTDPMKSQMGYLEVVIPPDVIDEDGSRDHSANEGGTLKLVCRATGIPAPNVTWRREDGKKIFLRNVVPPEVVHVYNGEVLELSNVHRSDMGSYLCIASNGIPPSVSKRYIVQVNFHPKVVVSNQLVAAPVGSDVLLHCYVESWPKAMHSWTKENGIKLMNIPKYHMEEYHINEYSLNMNLTIKDLEKHDFGGYNCSSVNALGKAESTVRLTELHIPTKTTLTPVTHDTGRRKVVMKQKTQLPPTKKPRKKMRMEEPTTPPPVPQIPTRPDWFDQQNEIDGSAYWHRAHFLQIFLALLVISAIC